MGGRLRARLLGAFTVEGFEERELGSRKARLLLRRLALANGAAVGVDELADVLWGDQLPARPADQVGVLVARLRRVLGPDRLRRSDEGYHLDLDWLDVAELEARAREANDALAEGRLAAARAAVDAALVLARGPLLAGQDGDWVEGARLRVASWLGTARRVGAQAAAAAGDAAGAVMLADAALADDPYDEAALRVKMSACAALGRRASALAAYAEVRHRLVEDLGVSPDAETERLHTALLLADGVDAGPSAASARSIVGPGVGLADGSGGPVTPLVGRDPELSSLDEAYREIEAGGCQLVAVVGEAGIGKSALVRRWVDDLAARAPGERPGTLCIGRCDELGRDLPLQPLADALAAELRAAGAGALDALAPADVAVLASALGLGLVPSRGPGVGSEGSVDRGDGRGDGKGEGIGGGAEVASLAGGAVADPSSGQVRLFGALLRAMEALAGRAPVVVVVEDLHWAGPSTLAWVAFARRRSDRLLLVTTRRPNGPMIAGETTLPIGALDRAAVAELVGDERADELHQLTGGHPLLLLAMASAVGAEDGAGAGADGSHGADGAGTDDEVDGARVPASIREIVGRELAALGPLAATVQAAAVLGSQIDLDLLSCALGSPALQLLDELEAVAATGLLRDDGRGYAFRHELVREAVAAGVGSARRALLHREAARALADRPHPPPLELALHARRGGDDDLAVRGWLLAAAEATARFDIRTAEALLSQAEAVSPSPEVLIARARVRIADFALDAAAADAARACATGGGAAAFEVAGWVAYYQRRYDEAGSLAADGLARAAAAGDPDARAGCLALAGRVRHGAGDLPGALDLLGQVREGPSATQAIAGVWRGQALVHGGRPLEALAATSWAVIGAGVVEHPFAGFHRAFTRSMALGQLGRLGDALAASDEFAALVERSGVVGARFGDRANNIRGWLLRNAGAFDEADAANRQALADTVSPGGDAPLGDVVAEPYWVSLLDLADGALLQGDVDGARALIERLAPMTAWRGSMAWHQRHRADLLRARLALAEGDGEAAGALAVAVADDAASREARRYQAIATALGALAGGPERRPPETLVDVIDVLAGCARLEGWWLTWRLGERYRIASWSARAEAWAGELVAASGPWASSMRRWVDAVLGGHRPW